MMKFKSYLAANYISNNKVSLFVIIFIGMLNSCITFLLPVSVGEFFLLQYQSAGSKGRLLQLLGIHFSSLTGFFGFFSILLLLKGILSVAEQWLCNVQGEKFTRRIRERLFTAQINHPAAVFQQKPYGNYLLRYSNDFKAARNYLLNGILGMLKNSVFLFIGFVLLALIHFKLALCFAGFFFLILSGTFMLANYQKRFIKKSRDKRSGLLAFVTRSFSSYRTIKENNSEQKIIQRFEARSEQVFRANLENYRIESLQQSLIPIMQYTLLGGLLLLSTTVAPAISYSDALVFVLVVLLLFSAMRRILKVPAIINKGNISLQKIGELIIPDPPVQKNKKGILKKVS